MLKKILLLSLALELAVSAATAAAKPVSLPEPKLIGKMTVEESIFRRRSERAFLPNELTLDQLSQLLWAGQGVTDRTWSFRAAPSAGALYPLYLYVVKKDGVFQYLPEGHRLKQIKTEDIRPSLVRASLGQNYIGEAPTVIVICGNFRISEAKYGQRSYRYINMEVGHVAENIHLQAVALGLISLPVGAFWDDVVARALELPETQDPYCIIPIGYLRSSS